MNFCTADDMNAVLAVKLRRRLGFGMWAKLHLLGMHVEGKVYMWLLNFITLVLEYQWPMLLLYLSAFHSWHGVF